MKIFFTSDQHFYHRNIIKYASRPFSLDNNGVLKCAETIFNNYNKVVSDEDIVFFLGDVFLTSERSWKAGLETVFRLKGRKILIKGNHDTLPDKVYSKCFEKIFDYLEIGDLLLCHYPDAGRYFNEIDINKYKLIVHGHIHNKPTPLPNGINVCVDYTPNNFSPVFNQNISDYILCTGQLTNLLTA